MSITKKSSIIVLAIFCVLINPFLVGVQYDKIMVLYGVSMVILISIIAFFMYQNGKLDAQKAIFLLFLISVIVRTLYVLNMPHYYCQHDTFSYESDIGHMAYIQYYLNNWQLPDFDPREVWQFYHPPLHHIISAVFMKIQLLFNPSLAQAAEGVQTLTYFYSLCISIVGIKIAKIMDLTGKSLVIASEIIIMHPTNVILAGSVNNDTLSVLLMLCTVYYGLKWYKNSSMKNIVITALFMGFSMLAKTSAVYTAPALAFIFLYKFIKSENRWQKYFAQFATFGLVSIPIGLSWVLRNQILFGMPISYVPMLGINDPQFVGWGLNRLISFDLSQFNTVHIEWENYTEHNIFTSILKTSVVGGWTNAQEGLSYKLVSYSLFWVNAFLAFLSLIAMIKNFIKKRTTKINYLLILYVSVMLTFIVFCFVFPHICTMDYRYVAITHIIGAVFLGLCVKKGKFGRVILITTIAFSVLAPLYHLVLICG